MASFSATTFNQSPSVSMSLLISFLMVAALGCQTPESETPSDQPASRFDIPVPVEISDYGQPDPRMTACVGTTSLEEKAFMEFEPHAAFNPADTDNIVVTWMMRAREASGAVVVSSTFDGGSTWSAPHTLGFHNCAGGIEEAKYASDPWVAFGPEGRAYVAAIAFDASEEGDTYSSLLVFYSSDGGKTWEGPGIAVPNTIPEYAYDNLALATDPKVPGMVYLVTTQYQTVAEPATDGKISDKSKAGPAAFTKSIDGGRTWGPIHPVTPVIKGERVSAPETVADFSGNTLYVVYYRETEKDAAIAVVSSSDQGENWSEQKIVAEYVRLNNQGFADTVVKLTDRAMMLTAQDIIHGSVDPKTGRVCIAFADGRFTNGDHLQVAVTCSSDKGNSWSQPHRVSSSPKGHAWLPSITFNNAGVLGISYLDIRDWEPTDTEHVPTSLWLHTFRFADDGAIEPLEELLVDQFNMLGAGAEGYYGTGDYQALLTTTERFHPVYVKSKCAPFAVDCLQPKSSRTGMFFGK
jgi:hypothetical protein